MIIGFHLTWTTYGHWFPNDPRGSWSEEVWKPELARIRALDDERKVTCPRAVAGNELQRFLNQAQSCLKHAPVELTASEIPAVAAAFAEAAASIELDVRACAILPKHVHLAVDRHADSYERIVDRLKGRSAQELRAARGYSMAANRRERIPIWTQGYWVRYIDHPEQLECTAEYVRNNPIREGLAPQNWDFVRGLSP